MAIPLTGLRVALRHHPLARQVRSFLGVGLVCTSLHYAILVAMVQGLHAPPVSSALTGFCVAGLLSYLLNRRHTFASERPHEQAAWRFALVAGVAFFLTWILMRLFVERWHAPYLGAQCVTTGLVMVWTVAANRLWTFRGEL